jgi:hypothetical protein
VIHNRKISNTDFNNQPLLLDEKRAAELLGVSLSSLRKARCEGQHGLRTAMPPYVRVGGRILYRRDDLIQWVASLRSYSHIGEEAAR